MGIGTRVSIEGLGKATVSWVSPQPVREGVFDLVLLLDVIPDGSTGKIMANTSIVELLDE